jgi:hypothetical protein
LFSLLGQNCYINKSVLQIVVRPAREKAFCSFSINIFKSEISIRALFGVAMGAALASQTIDYLIRYVFSTRIINGLIGRRRYLKAERKLRKYGNIAIFFFNFLPPLIPCHFPRGRHT